MTQVLLAAVLLVVCSGLSRAQSTDCYPRIGAYSGQYEGRCPGSDGTWIAVENTIGAYGRNCSGETWTYTRAEHTLQNHQTKEVAPISDCAEPSAAQLAGTDNSADSDAIRAFHEKPLRLPELSLRR